jgi:hypothetical protein
VWSENGPRDYDDGYVERIGYNIRFRLAYSHDKGDITRFVVQLEYRHGGDWTPVVRYDRRKRRGLTYRRISAW